MTEHDDALADAYAAILAEARRHVADRGETNVDALRMRIRGVTRAFQSRGLPPGDLERAEAAALRRLAGVAAVRRARLRLADDPKPPARPAPRPARLRTRPTVTGNMGVRGSGADVLEWDAAQNVSEWELRISDRTGPRGEYVVRETRHLPGGAASAGLPLGDEALRVHVLGRARGGRLVRRAIVSGLTRENWGERWERRASAS